MAPSRMDESWVVQDLGSSFIGAPKEVNRFSLSGRKTDYSRWRLRNDGGAQTWHYLESDEACKAWPQTIADKYFLGLEIEHPTLPTPRTPLDNARNGLTFFSRLQLPPGNWACEYGGPMFLLPGLVVTWYVTRTSIPEAYKIEIQNYLFARQAEDGGWGLHIEGASSVFGTAMNYVVLRLVGADADNPRMIKARARLHELGGAANGPHWAKFWLAVLGVYEWDGLNPLPPEFWLLPDWFPIAPWKWWIHSRQVFLPMSYIYSRRWSYPPDKLTLQLREELFIAPYTSIHFPSHRNSISDADNYHPKSALLNTINWALTNIWQPYLRPSFLSRQAEAWTWSLIEAEDLNSDYADLAPVNGALNFLACHVHDGPDSYSVRRHRERILEFIWVKNEGMLANGTNGVQTWDTAFTIQAAIDANLHEDPTFHPTLLSALRFLEAQQIRENCSSVDSAYRQRRAGAWAFSTKDQGYTVSDCTSEAMKSVLALQATPHYPTLVSTARLRQAIDVLLTMQNPGGGFSSYEPQRAGEWLEQLNAAEVFGRIMVEYDYPECTTAVVTALHAFRSQDASAYRRLEIDNAINRALSYIRAAQRPDGSWYGSWGICFSYAGMFALESLGGAGGETYENSERVRRACAFFIDRVNDDGGWGESYKACETGEWVDHPDGSQVVNTCWVVIALLHAEYPEKEPVRKAMRLVASRQGKDGSWKQEGIEGVFNKSCMISYPNYKFIFPVKAFGMYAKRWGNLWD